MEWKKITVRVPLVNYPWICEAAKRENVSVSAWCGVHICREALDPTRMVGPFIKATEAGGKSGPRLTLVKE